MNDPKPLASLGPSLLARKGTAKPAMRPQAPGFAAANAKTAPQSLEDLGWNDMGEDDAAADHSAEVLQLTPAPANPASEAKTDKGSPKPKVRTMHEELEARLAESGQDSAPAIPMRRRPALPRSIPRVPHHATTLLSSRMPVLMIGSPSLGTSAGHGFTDMDAR